MSRSCGCAAAAKPKSLGRPSLISVHVSPESSLRCMPQWFCWYMRVGSAAERTSLWTQKPTSSCSRGHSARKPRLRGVHDCAAVPGLEHADPLHDRPEARRVVVVQHHRRDAEVPGRLVRRVVPDLRCRADRRASSARDQSRRRPGSRRCPAPRRRPAHVPATPRASRPSRSSSGVVAVGEALARERPRLAEVAASPDGRAVPFARCGRVDRARRPLEHGVVDRPGLAVRAAQRPSLGGLRRFRARMHPLRVPTSSSCLRHVRVTSEVQRWQLSFSSS